MRKISDAIQEGAEAFLRRQYRTIGLLSIALGVLIYVLYAFFRKPHAGEPAAATLALTTTLSFLFGALCSGVAGIVGMRSEEHRLNSSHLVISYAVFCLK